jgi:hypothetical protein
MRISMDRGFDIPPNLAIDRTASPLEQLRQEYLWMTTFVLPQLATQRQFPVGEEPCFQRIILDNLLGQRWDKVLDRPQEAAYRQLSEPQLREAIALAHSIVHQPDSYLHKLNHSSLQWRGQAVPPLPLDLADPLRT